VKHGMEDEAEGVPCLTGQRLVIAESRGGTNWRSEHDTEPASLMEGVGKEQVRVRIPAVKVEAKPVFPT